MNRRTCLDRLKEELEINRRAMIKLRWQVRSDGSTPDKEAELTALMLQRCNLKDMIIAEQDNVIATLVSRAS